MLKSTLQSPAATTQRVLPCWWQLPFSFATGWGAMVFYQCRLCQLYPTQSHQISRNRNRSSAIIPPNVATHPHWFNRQRFLCPACHDSIAWHTSQFSVEILCQQTPPPVSQNSTHLLIEDSSTSSVQTLKGVAGVFYRYPYNVAIAKFKNQHDMMQLPLLVHAIRQMPPPQGCNHLNSVIVPVPTTPERLKRRGFDPVNMLARYLSFHWQIPLFCEVSREERQTQQGLSRTKRLQNVENVFMFHQLPPVKRIILFDDVATTGATLQALAQSLINAVNSPEKYQIHIRALAHGH